MFVYRYNPFLKKYFRYDVGEYDAHEGKFDERLHINEHDPMELPRQQCSYCGYNFDSRNKLFHHLAFMGIDTRKNKGTVYKEGECDEADEYNSEMGDFGFEMTLNRLRDHNKRRSKRRRRDWYRRRHAMKNIAKKRRVADIALGLRCLGL